MKTIKIIVTVFSLMLMYSFIAAQPNCHGDNIMVYKGGLRCGCSCKKKCVSPDELQYYLDNGWNMYGCFTCCWVNADESNPTPEAALAMETPVPASHALIVSFRPSIETEVTIRVMDMTGRYVETVTSEFLEAGDNALAWDESGLSPGIYFLHINAGADSETKMIPVMD